LISLGHKDLQVADTRMFLSEVSLSSFGRGRKQDKNWVIPEFPDKKKRDA